MLLLRPNDGVRPRCPDRHVPFHAPPSPHRLLVVRPRPVSTAAVRQMSHGSSASCGLGDHDAVDSLLSCCYCCSSQQDRRVHPLWPSPSPLAGRLARSRSCLPSATRQPGPCGSADCQHCLAGERLPRCAARSIPHARSIARSLHV